MARKLDRSISLFSAVNIGIGTMLGSAIFVLVGTSMDFAGPSSFIAVGLAGLAAIFTAFSFAELVTVIPTAGGGYAYVREASRNGVIGFISGWAFWLGYAMSCGLFAIGFGIFVMYLLNFVGVSFPPIIASYLLILAFVLLNIKGSKNSTKLQNWITGILIAILLVYISIGIFHINPENFKPLAPFGFRGTFKALSILYITYIGYGLITTMSEEVQNPEVNIPKSIFISTIIVTIIKILVFFIAAGIMSWELLSSANTGTPMIDTAISIAGPIGGVIFAFAGLLATTSSINTSILASSRTSYALSKDRKFPSAFCTINSITKTPVISILMAGIIAVISTSLQNIEKISTITALFSLIGYSFVNIAVIMIRKQNPDAKRAFKVPLFPLFPIVGVLINCVLIFQLISSDISSTLIALSILVLGTVYYYIIYPKMQNLPKGFSPAIMPTITPNTVHLSDDQYKILTPLGNPKTADSLLNLSFILAKGSPNGVVVPIHVVEVPDSIPINSNFTEFKSALSNFKLLSTKINQVSKHFNAETDPILIYSRKRSDAILHFAYEKKIDLALIGWHKSGLAYNMLYGMVPIILKSSIPTVGIYKFYNENTNKIKKILFPYTGGIYCKSAATIIKRIASYNNSFVTLLNIVDKETSLEERLELQQVFLSSLEALDVKGEIKTVEVSNLKDSAITIIKESVEHDLLILGMEARWDAKNTVSGFSTDTVTEHAKCNVLLIRDSSTVMHSSFFRKLIDSINRV
ncbi:MAG: amino acid permease [Caldisericia bacterium]|nr:amino acid permease [Caldisericia bacterium]